MKKPVFTGVCTALVTPFLDDKVNYPLIQQLLKFQMESGVKAVVLSGTTGEAPTLSDKEKIDMIRCSKEYVGNDCTIIAGTGSNNTAHAVELAQQAEESGADALLVVSPYYNKANEDGLIAHYMTIAHCVKIPVIIYNVPSRTGVDIPISVYKRLAAIPNIAGVKEANHDIAKVANTAALELEDFSIWSGNDDLTVPIMSLGGAGVISVLSNIYPIETVAMVNAALAGDFDSAAALQNELMLLIKLLFCDVNPIPIKYAMRYAGFDCGKCRLPLMLSKATKQAIDAYFA